MNLDAAGLARIQSESRIPATTWREWCTRLHLEPAQAIELWEDVCHPMMLVSGEAPDIPMILQLRAARPQLYVDEFRDELPAVLLSTTLVESLQDEGQPSLRSAFIRLYRHLGDAAGDNPVARSFVAHAGVIGLLGGVLREEQAISKLVRILGNGRTLGDLVRFGQQTAQDHPYGIEISDALEQALALLSPVSRKVTAPRTADEVDPTDPEGRGPAPARGPATDAPTEATGAKPADGEDISDEPAGGGGGEDEDGSSPTHAEQEAVQDSDTAPATMDEAPAPDGGDADRPPDPYETFLAALKTALFHVYVEEAFDMDVRAARRRVVEQFDPLRSRIPTIEEARSAAAERTPGGGGGGVRQKPGVALSSLPSPGGGAVITSGRVGGGMRVSTTGGGGGSAGGGGGGGSRVLKPGGGARAGGARAGGGAAKGGGQGPGAGPGMGPGQLLGPAKTGGPATGGGTFDSGETAAGGQAAGNAVASAAADTKGKLVAPVVTRRDLDECVGLISGGLTHVRELDPRIWQLFTEAEHVLDDPRALAEALHEQDSDGQRAGDALRQAAQQQRVRSILNLPPDRRLKDRRFDLETEAWLNAAHNNKRALDPDSRLLIPVPKILDRAVAALVRVEALRAAVDVVRAAEDLDLITPGDVAARYEPLLADLTYLASSAVVADARERADADAAAVLAAVAADTWIERVRGDALDWVDAAIAAGAFASADALEAHWAASPLTDPGVRPRASAAAEAATEEAGSEADAGAGAAVDGADADGAPGPAASKPPANAADTGPFPEELAQDTALGEIVDSARGHVLRAVWDALGPAHAPLETVKALDTELRLRLRCYARIVTRRERHHRNPKVALPVASLERLTGNPELAHLYVRLTTDGRLLFAEGYEDGSYIDIFELQESRRRQMHARARERARSGDGAELQTGASYLHTRGRTRNPFATTEAAVMAACVRDDEGEPLLFDPF